VLVPAHVKLPDKFFDGLPQVLKDAPPLPGEEARYAQILAVLAVAQKDPALKGCCIPVWRRRHAKIDGLLPRPGADRQQPDLRALTSTRCW
jgi:hypothetical protein